MYKHLFLKNMPCKKEKQYIYGVVASNAAKSAMNFF